MVSSEWRISIGEYEIVNDSQWTVRSLLRNTAVQFEERGIESPRLTAELLLAQILQMKRVELYLDFDREILEEVIGSHFFTSLAGSHLRFSLPRHFLLLFLPGPV